jgi:hypothetical protein
MGVSERDRLNGGEGGIRTPDSLATMSDFESGAFNRALPPLRVVNLFSFPLLHVAVRRSKPATTSLLAKVYWVQCLEYPTEEWSSHVNRKHALSGSPAVSFIAPYPSATLNQQKLARVIFASAKTHKRKPEMYARRDCNSSFAAPTNR